MNMRYRKIFCKMWGDEWFRSLSQPQPCAAWLWVWLLTGDLTEHMPGIIRAGENGMAESLGWPLEAFREAFREVLQKGNIKASQKDRLVWIKNAIVYNPPSSPNVAKSWGCFLRDYVQECPLKNEIIQDTKAFLKGFPKGFLEAFEEGLAKVARARDQDQDQDQKQKQERRRLINTPPDPPAGGEKKFDPGHYLSTRYKIPDQIAADWLTLRKQKKAPATKTAIDRIAREAKKADIPLADAMEYCVAMGWQGFRADWWREQQKKNQPAKGVEAIREWLAEKEEEKRQKAASAQSEQAQSGGSAEIITPTFEGWDFGNGKGNR